MKELLKATVPQAGGASYNLGEWAGKQRMLNLECFLLVLPGFFCP